MNDLNNIKVFIKNMLITEKINSTVPPAIWVTKNTGKNQRNP